MIHIPEGPYESKSDLLRNKSVDLLAFDISPLISYEQFVSFLNEYQKKYPDRIDPETHELLDSGNNKLFVESYEISYESSIDNSWRNNRSLWKYLPIINIPGSFIQDWIEKDHFFVHYDYEKPKSVQVTWVGAQEFCTHYGLELPSGIQAARAKQFGHFSESDKEWEVLWISPPDMNQGLKRVRNYHNDWEDLDIRFPDDLSRFRCVKNETHVSGTSVQPASVYSQNLSQDLTPNLLMKISSDQLVDSVTSGKKYFSEDFFHYYIQKDAFTEEEQNIIHATYIEVSKLLASHGFPVKYQYRGLFNSQIKNALSHLNLDYAHYPMEIESYDKRNVIYRGPLNSSLGLASSYTLKESPLLAVIGQNYSYVEIGSDIILQNSIRTYPYIDDHRTYHPCLCEIMTEYILKNLNYSDTFALTYGPGTYTNFSKEALVNNHIHLSILDYFYTNTKRQQNLDKVLQKTKVVERPKLDLIKENDDVSVYKVMNGIYVKFSDHLRKQYYKGDPLQVTIINPSSIREKLIADTLHLHSDYTDPPFFSQMDTLFTIQDMQWDPMIGSLPIGRMREKDINNNPEAGTAVILRVFEEDHPERIISSLPFSWPDLRHPVLDNHQ